MLAGGSRGREVLMFRVLYQLMTLELLLLRLIFRRRNALLFENLALRQQLALFHVKMKPARADDATRSFFVALSRVWDDWVSVLVAVKPETVIDWQRRRFKSYWRSISGHPAGGGKPRSFEIRRQIRKIYEENGWGASRIYSELLMLGYTERELSETTVARCLRAIRKKTGPTADQTQSWKTFLKNHRDGIAAMDFFTVPTVKFQLLYVFFIISHARRRIIHFACTLNPTAEWVLQQLREAFPFDEVPRYLIFDRGSPFPSLRDSIHAMGISPIMTGYQSPWQNGVAERFVLSVRSDLLNRVIVLNEKHLHRLMKEYISYYNEDRCHLAVSRDSPAGREKETRPEKAELVALPRLGGLQHRYTWKKAA